METASTDAVWACITCDYDVKGRVVVGEGEIWSKGFLDLFWMTLGIQVSFFKSSLRGPLKFCLFLMLSLLKISTWLGRGQGLSHKASFNPVEKSAQIRIWLDFFFTWTVGADHSLTFVFDRIPACSSLSNSLLICSRAAKGTFRFFLNTGCAPSFTLSLAFNLDHFPRPPEKIVVWVSYWDLPNWTLYFPFCGKMYWLGNPIDWIFLSNLFWTSRPNFLVRRLSAFC